MAAAIGALEGFAEHRFFSEMEHIPRQLPSIVVHQISSRSFCAKYMQSQTLACSWVWIKTRANIILGKDVM